MNPARIAELLQPFLEEERLSSAQLSHISTYINILLRWNARINLTAIRDPEEIVTRHFGESLFAARHLFPSVSSAHVQTTALAVPQCSSVSPVVKASKLADLGTGAGFPGIPMKLWAPHVALTLIESSHKKATFLREVVRALTLTNVDIQNARAQSLPPRTYDVVTLRAVEKFEAVVAVAASLVADDGRLALLIGSAQVPQLQTALPFQSISALLPIPSSSSKVLAVVEKPRISKQEW